MSDGTTHYAGCVGAGPKHYECALQEIGRLRGTITHLRAELEKETQRRFDGNEIASKEHREEVAALQVDAERYRWLRDDKRGRSLSVSSLEWTGNPELSDAAVDAAMIKEKNGG